MPEAQRAEERTNPDARALEFQQLAMDGFTRHGRGAVVVAPPERADSDFWRLVRRIGVPTVEGQVPAVYLSCTTIARAGLEWPAADVATAVSEYEPETEWVLLYRGGDGDPTLLRIALRPEEAG